MPGHTKGHAAVAVETADRGIVIHGGDAAFDVSSYTPTVPSGEAVTKSRRLRGIEWFAGVDRKRIAGNHATLRRLNEEADVTVVNAHDKRMLDALIGSCGTESETA